MTYYKSVEIRKIIRWNIEDIFYDILWIAKIVLFEIILNVWYAISQSEVIIMDENKIQLFEDQKIRTAWDEEKAF